MARPYGSVANPVVLDPFRRIVEVHWGNSNPPVAFAFCVRVEPETVTQTDFSVDHAPQYYNPSSYSLGIMPPRWWTAFVLTDDGEWNGAASSIINGMPEFGPPPLYEIGPWTNDIGSQNSLRWIDPVGSSTGIPAPVIGFGETEPRIFKLGAASIAMCDVSTGAVTASVMAWPSDITVQSGILNYAYAGAVAVPKHITGADQELIGGPGNHIDYELWIICIPVTA